MTNTDDRYGWLISELLQYRAELNQGLNELANNKTAIEQAKSAIATKINALVAEAERKARIDELDTLVSYRALYGESYESLISLRSQEIAQLQASKGEMERRNEQNT